MTDTTTTTMPEEGPYTLRDDQIRNLSHVSRPQHRKPPRPEHVDAAKRLRDRIKARPTPWDLGRDDC